jgi:hypothetical protein
MRRVGRQLLIQTPDLAFPVEPHFVMPFVHWMPRRAGRAVVEISPWRLLSQPTKGTIDHYFWGTQLLSSADIRTLFPGCEYHSERFMGLSKSHMVVCPGLTQPPLASS